MSPGSARYSTGRRCTPRHHPDKLAHWVNATIADGTTSRRSKLGQKRSDAIQHQFNDQVLGQLRYNPIILLPMLNDICRVGISNQMDTTSAWPKASCRPCRCH